MRTIWKSDQKNRIWKDREQKSLVVSFLMMVLCGAFSLFQPLYLNVDNYQAALVLNRVYDTDNYCMFLNPVLCLFSGFLQDIIPSADGFTLLSRVMILLGIWYLGYCIADVSSNKREWFCGYLILFLLVINASLFFDYFMVWASFFTCAGMVALVSAIQKEDWKSAAVGTAFVACGVMWRMESAALFMPFLVLELLTRLLFRANTRDKRRRQIRKACRILGPVVLCVFFLVAIDLGYKSSERYSLGVEFNNAVSSVVDFPMEDHADIADHLPGISRNDYESLRSHMYADTDQIDAVYARTISGAGSRDAGESGIFGLLKANTRLLQIIASSRKTLFSVFLLLLLFLCLVLSDTMWYNKLELLLAGGGAYLIMLYFTFIGRIPLRIINSVLYAVFGIVLILHMQGSLTGGRASLRWGKRFIGLFVLLVVCADMVSYDFIWPQSVFRVRNGADEDKWKSTYGEGEIYLWKTSEYVLHPMQDFIEQGKFMTEEFLAHNLSYGDWVYGQVYYDQYLERLGISNPVKALIGRERTYYVALDETGMLTWLQEHYNETIRVRKVREIEQIPVWEFLLSEETKESDMDIKE